MFLKFWSSIGIWPILLLLFYRNIRNIFKNILPKCVLQNTRRMSYYVV